MSKPAYLPFAKGQWQLSMGLKPLQLQDWIEIGEDFVAQLALKSQLFERRYADVLATLPGSQTAQQEVLELLVNHLLQTYPQYYQRQGQHLCNRTTGQIWRSTDFEEPLDLAGRLVQEDLCLLLPAQDGYLLSAAAVCFPSRWNMPEKMGKPIANIHHAVPGYAEKLERPVDHFFDRLKVDRPGYRLNWGIVDRPDLFLEPSPNGEESDPTITTKNAGDRLWLRVERQTLRRLPQSNGVLFTIRTFVDPLRSLASDPIAVRDLAAAIEQIPAAMQAYKSMLPFRSALSGYLQALICS